MGFLWECMKLSIEVAIGGAAWTGIAVIIAVVAGAIFGMINSMMN